MRRRDFNISLLLAGTATRLLRAEEQTKQRRIAIVTGLGKPENISEAGSAFWRAFFAELRKLGHFEGVIWSFSVIRPKAIPVATSI